MNPPLRMGEPPLRMGEGGPGRNSADPLRMGEGGPGTFFLLRLFSSEFSHRQFVSTQTQFLSRGTRPGMLRDASRGATGSLWRSYGRLWGCYVTEKKSAYNQHYYEHSSTSSSSLSTPSPFPLPQPIAAQTALLFQLRSILNLQARCSNNLGEAREGEGGLTQVLRW